MKAIPAIPLAILLAAAAVAAPQPPEGGGESTETTIRRALEAMNDDRLDEAVELLEPLGRRPDAEVRVLAILGALYLEAGRAADALRLLQPLAESEDAEPAVLYNAGRAALAVGQRGQGEHYLQRSLEKSPGTPAARELGLLRGARGDFAEAYELLLPWARAHPEDAEARTAAALCAVQLQRVPEAEELLSDLPQDRPRVRLLWGHVQLLKGDPWGALATLKPLAESPPPEIAGDLRRLLAEAHATAGQAAEAVAVLKDHVGGSPSVALQLAQAQYQSGDLAGALATLAPFAERVAAGGRGADLPEETAAGIAREYGRWRLLGGDYAAALPHLETATRLRPGDKQSWQALGQTLAGLGRREEAESALARFRELAAAEPPTSSVDRRARQELSDPTGRELRRAFELLAAGRGEEALRVARTEKGLARGDLRPSLAEGRILLALERPREARAVAEEVLAAAPGSPDALYLRGTVRMALGELAGAEADFRKALAAAPQHTASMNDLAVILIERGQTAEARGLLEKVLEINPDDEVAAANLAGLRSP